MKIRRLTVRPDRDTPMAIGERGCEEVGMNVWVPAAVQNKTDGLGSSRVGRGKNKKIKGNRPPEGVPLRKAH